MTDPKLLYSYQGNEPQPLPHQISWVEEWGQITYRTDVNTFTDEEIEKAGYTGPYSFPTYDRLYEYISWNKENLQYDILPKSYENLLEKFTENVIDLLNIVNNLLSEFLINPSYVSDEKKLEFKNYKKSLEDIKENLPKTREEIINFSWPVIPEYDRLSSTIIDNVISGFSTCINTSELASVLISNNLNLNYLHNEDQIIIMKAGDESLNKNM